MTTGKTLREAEAETIAQLDEAEARAEKQQNAHEAARITAQHKAALSDFIDARRRAGDTIVEWSDLTKMPWQFGTLIVYEYDGDHYWVGRQATSLQAAKTAQTVISDSYVPAGFLVTKQGGVSPLLKLRTAAAFDARHEYEKREARIAENRQAASDRASRERDEWFGRKTRTYAPTTVYGVGTSFDKARLSALKERMAEFGIQATRNRSSGRILVSRPDGGGPMLHQSKSTFDLALRFADYLVDDPGKCDVAKCVKKADVVTDSGAVICTKHAGVG